MQVFKAFFKTVKKQLSSLVIYFGIFLGLTVMLTSNGRIQDDTTYKPTKVKIAVIDQDNSTLSKSLYDYIDTNHTIVTIKTDKESMADELFYRNVEYILTIKDGFEDNIKAGKYDGIVENIQVSKSVSGVFLDSQIEQYLKTLNTYISAGYSASNAAQLTFKTSSMSADVSMHTKEGVSNQYSATYFFFSFVPYILICILTVGLGSILVTFREENLNARIQCSSISVTKKNISLTLSSLIFSIICWASFMLLATVMYNEDLFTTKGLLYMANSLVFLFVAMSLTYLISYFVHSDSTLNMVSNVLGLGLSFLGGIFVPLQYLSSTVLTIAKFLPTYWYVTANDVIESYSGTSEQINKFLSCLGIELVIALAIFAAALVASKVKKH